MAIWQTAGKVRMTPKGVYSSNTAYEILDIVSNTEQTISYIAKQAVPAGTALTNTTYWAVIADVTEALENADAAISYIGDSYSSSSTYAVGDYVIHDGGLYRCKTAISTAEAWTAAHWQQVSVTDEFFNFSDDVVKVSNTQPTSVFNRVWIDSETESEEVPTYEEFQELESDVSDLKSATGAVEGALGKTNIGNLVMETTTGKLYRYNSSNEIYAQDNSSYMCAVIDVSDLDFVTSTTNFGSTNFQFFGTDTAFVATGASQRTSDSGYVFAIPQGATKLYLSFQKSVWDIAVCAGRDSITSKTISDLPVGGTYAYESLNILKDEVEDVYKTVLTTTARNVQYLDNSKVANGYYWSGTTKVQNESYRAFDPISVPAGTYYISNSASSNFTYVDINGVASKLSTFSLISMAEYACYCVEFESDATLYVSGGYPSSYKVAVSTIPIKPSEEEYVFGEFLESPYKVVRVGSTRPYKTLKSALEAVENVFDAYVYADAEEFDLVQEFGQEFLDSYSTAASFGLFLKNRVHLIFAAGSKVVFNYTGNNSIVHEWFSPFNAGRYGFELVGANIESINCRYSVHDEHGAENEPYRNVYKGCAMKHNSTGTSWGAHQCIGGGLGLHGTIDIEDSTFEAVGETVDASYHAPNTNENASSRVSVRNCYFNGTFRMSKMGTGVSISRGYVSGNSVAALPYVSGNAGAAENVEMLQWNNVVRP